jgi:hypothetical protein
MGFHAHTHPINSLLFPFPSPPLTLQACSILYKSRLPLLLVFNKVDVVRHEFALEWMADFDNFHAALESETTYAASLSRWGRGGRWGMAG